MASRFSDVMWIMEQILFMSFDQRLAIFLIEQSAIQESDDIHITHENIAKNMGSAREVVTRMLNYFQDEGIVELHRGGIKIIDRKRLEAMQ
jgi:CRP/FNR family transcriptional regulator